jgi:uncharacterized protein YaiE (UPF0345 family)
MSGLFYAWLFPVAGFRLPGNTGYRLQVSGEYSYESPVSGFRLPGNTGYRFQVSGEYKFQVSGKYSYPIADSSAAADRLPFHKEAASN